ncbi:exonuclease domain-containing protein [Anaerobacillus alkalilacustris]|uniref:exonuclease domain-containing protein n=1 Tax=Anaerobacillus alkalilacustris TaxID=393763 RepID=UPI000A945B79|nr:exonuclease domain-containing protein [Anaerobacillus alkalilacustris]
MHSYDFIAIDFEIANHNYSSACSLGMVFVDERKIVDEKYYLIQPPNLELDEEFSKIHSLTLDQLSTAPLFHEVWDEIKPFFNDDSLIIAHNAQFDMNTLKNCLIENSLNVPNFKYVCSIPISTRACRGEGIGSSLKERTKRFGITLDDHHHALSDARACAELVIKCLEVKKRKTIHSYCKTYSSIPVKLFSDLKTQSTFLIRGKRKKFDSVKIAEITPTTSNIDNNHPFYNRLFVFTGNLETIDRKNAMQKVVDVGGIIKSGVTKNTDYIIVGKQDLSIVGKDGLSSKERKAYELIEKGINIKVLNEDQFLKNLKLISNLK